MKFIKVLNNPNGVKCMSSTFAIYEMETAAELEAAHGHKYLVSRKFTELAMTEMDIIEDLILRAVKDNKYVYGVGFCDTIRECELFFIASSLQVKLNKISDILGNNSSICGKLGAADLSCAVKKVA